MLKHKDSRLSAYSAEQMFRLVADVERYPEFLPWCRDVRLLSRNGNRFSAEVHVGAGFVSERFVSHDVLHPADENGVWRIEATSREAPFKSLDSLWTFTPQAQGCSVVFAIDFAFRSVLLNATLGGVFKASIAEMTTAFEQRAADLYG